MRIREIIMKRRDFRPLPVIQVKDLRTPDYIRGNGEFIALFLFLIFFLFLSFLQDILPKGR